MHLPTLFSDLALMLITAAVVTLIFKKLRQPLVLGYILAGFLIGPHFALLPNVADTASVSTWSEIGVTVLMFCLGLEFSLHKLASVGGTAIITAITEVAGLLFVGYGVGQLLGWSDMNSIFLGGMLSMSSTTIIIKAYNEMGLNGKKFTGPVFGTLIIEDIAGVFMMIVLTTISVSKNISGVDLALTLGQLVLYLVVWLLLGVYLLPSFLNKTVELMNDETLLVTALGLCFGMVILANYLGFSSALGAFLAGSLLAGTRHAERVAGLTAGVRDLFGSIFFISVGMMVDPALLVEYWLPILLITLVTIVGKIIFSSGGMLLAGQSLSMAIHCGFSLPQIGEFAFIIASLGLSLGVTADFLYPIVVSVSVLTTLTTPFFISHADKAIGLAQRHLPQRLLDYLNRYTDEEQSEREQDSVWQEYLRRCLGRTALYGAIMLAIMLAGTRLLLPFLLARFTPVVADVAALLPTYLGMAVFVRPLLDLREPRLTALWLGNRANRLPLAFLVLTRIVMAALLFLHPLTRLFSFNVLWLLPLVAALVVALGRVGFLSSSYLRFEAHFLANFNERLLGRDEDDHSGAWLDERLHMASFRVAEDAPLIGERLDQLHWGRRYQVYCVRIEREGGPLNMPMGAEQLRGGDLVWLLGEERPLANVFRLLRVRPEHEAVTLRAYIAAQKKNEPHQLFCCATQVRDGEQLSGRTIRDSGLREKGEGFLLGLQRDNLPIVQPDVEMVLRPGDLIWLLGTEKLVKRLAESDLLRY